MKPQFMQLEEWQVQRGPSEETGLDCERELINLAGQKKKERDTENNICRRLGEHLAI